MKITAGARKNQNVWIGAYLSDYMPFGPKSNPVPTPSGGNHWAATMMKQ
jgi:hypothetical protein